jgi:hypothetical protein
VDQDDSRSVTTPDDCWLYIHSLRGKLVKISFANRFYLQETFFTRHKNQ